MTIYIGPGADHWRHEMSKLPPPFPELAEGMYIASSNAELDNITRYELLEEESSIKHVLSAISHVRISLFISISSTRIDNTDNCHFTLQGTHVFLTGGVWEPELGWAKEAGTAWYRSKETVPIHDPFVGGGFLSNKKWPLIEECTLLTIITVGTLILRATTLNTEVSSSENSLYKVFR